MNVMRLHTIYAKHVSAIYVVFRQWASFALSHFGRLCIAKQVMVRVVY